MNAPLLLLRRLHQWWVSLADPLDWDDDAWDRCPVATTLAAHLGAWHIPHHYSADAIAQVAQVGAAQLHALCEVPTTDEVRAYAYHISLTLGRQHPCVPTAQELGQLAREVAA